MKIRAIAVVISAASLAAACSGGSTQFGGDLEPDPDDELLARSALVAQADLQPGYQGLEREEDDDDNDEVFAEIAGSLPTCEGYEQGFDLAGRGSRTAEAESPRFALDEFEIEHTVTVFSSEAEADTTFDLLLDDDLVACARDVFGPFLERLLATDPEAPPIDDISVTVGRTTPSTRGDEATAIQIQITFLIAGQTGDVYFDLQATRVGRAVSGLNFRGNLLRVGLDEQQRLVEIAEGRLTESFG